MALFLRAGDLGYPLAAPGRAAPPLPDQAFAEAGLPGPLQYERMRQVGDRHGTKPRPWHRLDSGRAAVEGQKLHLEGFTTTMNVHYRPNVTRPEARGREIIRENDSIMFFEHRASSTGTP